MVARFLEYIQQHRMIDSSHRPILLACSGGVDSMCLAHLLLKAKIPFAIAHCNFGLRGEESEQDASFVQGFALKNNIEYHQKNFHKAFVKTEGIQERARTLRYQWFDQLIDEHGFQSVATAHHLNDQTETVLFHLSRGAGMQGMMGIKPKSRGIIRPLLCVTKNEILDFAQQNGIEFRNDSSNNTTKYTRNKIRLDAIPVLEEVNKNVHHAVDAFCKRVTAVQEIVDALCEELKKVVFDYSNDCISFYYARIKSTTYYQQLVFELLKDFGVDQSSLNEVMKLMNAPTGKRLHIGNYLFEKKNNRIDIYEAQPINFYQQSYSKKELEAGIQEDLHAITLIKVPKSIEFNNHLFYISADALEYPLTVRYWQSGDYFTPYNFKGNKKISDFLTSIKVAGVEKKKVKVLVSNNTIIAVLGYAIAHQVRITSSTKYCLQIKKENYE